MLKNFFNRKIIKFVIPFFIITTAAFVSNKKPLETSAWSGPQTSTAGNYYASVGSETGSTLKTKLKGIISSGTKESYDWSRFEAADEAMGEPNKVLLIYSRQTVAKSAHVTGSTGWNREHSFAKSLFGNASPAVNDNHHIFADDNKTNGHRDNKPFNELNKSSSTRSIDGYGNTTDNYYTNSYFMPNDLAKGEVARATMYMNTRYGYSVTLNFYSVDLMIKWHLENPVTDREIYRNNTVHTLQKNRNPFIDHPEYACSIWGNENATTKNLCASAPTVDVTSVSVTPTSGSVEVNNTLALTSTVLPTNATNKNVTWRSSNNIVATVSNGIVTGKAVGSAVITVASVSDPTKTAEATITVTSNQVAVSRVELNKESATLRVGESETLSATVLPANATNKNVVWNSSQPSVATVSSSGLVEAKAVGTTIISVTSTSDSTKKATATITVVDNQVSVMSVTLNKESSTLKIGESETLTATVLPSNATNKALLWESSNEEVATVSEDGLVSALSVGTTTISATSLSNPTIKAEALITVESGEDEGVAVTGVSLNKEKLTMNIGHSETLKAGVYPSNATNKAVVWESSDPEVASVTEEGKVDALAVGKAVISATSVSDDTKKASATITVTEEDVPVTGVVVNKKELIMDVGDSETLNAVVLPNYATNKALNWQSSSEEIAAVSEVGLVTAIAFGSAKITVLTVDGAFKEFVYITVRSASESGETPYQKALGWSASFLSLTREGCETSDSALLSEAWLEGQSAYNALEVEAQEIIKETPTGYTEGDSISHAKARYRIILNQYQLNDFIDNPVASNQELANDSTPYYLVFVVFGLMLASVITGIVIYKSKKVKIA